MNLNSTLRYRIVAIGERFHWLDRKTQEPLTSKDGSEAQWDDLDAAIQAFTDGKLSVEKNEELR